MEPNDGSSTSARASALRADLTTRQDAEELLAEASATRRAAASAADALVAEAQHLSQELVSESRQEAEQVLLEARERAQGVLQQAREEGEEITRQARAAAESVRARAEAQVEEYRRRVRAEVTEQVTREFEEQNREQLAVVHERQQSMIGDLEASVRILGVALEGATANVGEMLGSLESLRVHTAENLGDPGPAVSETPRHATGEPPGASDHLFRSTTPGDVEQPAPGTAVPGGTSRFDDPGVAPAAARARGGVATGDADPAPHLVAAAASSELDELTELASRIDSDDDPPMTATEAFLRSAGVDHDDPPLPPVDQQEVGARYARDAMRATARARTRQDEETLEVVPERRRGADALGSADAASGAQPSPPAGEGVDGEGDPAARPLGWLFRSS